MAESWGVGQVLSVFWFTLFFIWIWLLVMVFTDILRSPDLGGGAKALWTIFVVLLPYLGGLSRAPRLNWNVLPRSGGRGS